MADTWEKVKRWRARAEELHTIADQFRNATHREELRRIADTYERLANDAEARLIGRGRRNCPKQMQVAVAPE
ncbi:MAG TPA: hypothetical protein VE993_07855 [Stellaceae bacterium]|nr:hypothetical protein [Stellaceae bacterium]